MKDFYFCVPDNLSESKNTWLYLSSKGTCRHCCISTFMLVKDLNTSLIHYSPLQVFSLKDRVS